MSLPACNGWTNYPTWSLYTWITNMEESYFHVVEVLQATVNRVCWENRDEPPERRKELATYAATDALKEHVEDEFIPELSGSLASDLLHFAVSHIDWDSVAKAFLDGDVWEAEDDWRLQP